MATIVWFVRERSMPKGATKGYNLLKKVSVIVDPDRSGKSDGERVSSLAPLSEKNPAEKVDGLPDASTSSN